MGYFRHNAIVVTDCTEAIHTRAIEIMGQFSHLVSPLINSMMNGVHSFFVAPDGSKEGWAHSNSANVCRERLIDYLRTTNTDWVEIGYGGDNPECAQIEVSNDDAMISRLHIADNVRHDVYRPPALPAPKK